MIILAIILGQPKNENNMIDIKPISEIMNESRIKVDELGREYDYSMKNYKVLCRNGWSDVKYVYRHKTNKPIYNISDSNNNLSVDVTEDHSLFDENKNEIKPSEIRKNTELEYYSNDLNFNNIMANMFLVRLIYPSYFFNLYDQYIESREVNKKMFLYMKKSHEYESLITKIYSRLSIKNDIKAYMWIFKVQR